MASSVWRVSLRLSRRIWWLPVRPHFTKTASELQFCRTVGDCALYSRSQFTVSSSRRGRRNCQNGGFKTSVKSGFNRHGGVVAACAMAQENEPVPPKDVLSTARSQLQKHKIYLPQYSPGEYRVLCPECDGGSSREKSLGVTITQTGFSIWNCFRGTCGWKGPPKSRASSLKSLGPEEPSSNGSARLPTPSREVKPSSAKVLPLSIDGLKLMPDLADGIIEWFRQRGITRKTLEKCQVMQSTMTGAPKKILKNNQVQQWTITSTEKDVLEVVLAFPYMRDTEIVNCKFRSVEKNFWQVKGAEKVLYGLDDIKDAREIIIVEGEIDKLTLYEAGYINCVSVPDGAPPKASADEPLPPPTQDKKYEYLYNCREYFKQATRIVLATDADQPGQALAEELARRLGRERCWRVKWPNNPDGKLCKDANEVLQHLGAEAVREVIETSELYPIRGLFKFSHFFREIDDYYYLRLGDERGVSTGWRGLDDFYRVVPGELTVITGVPNSGKSEWIDALLCNLSRNKRWTFALCSMENKVREHGRKLLEKYMRLPFFDAP